MPETVAGSSPIYALVALIAFGGCEQPRPPVPTRASALRFTGWTPDGQTFDTSEPGKTAAILGMSVLIPGLAEGLGAMRMGEKRRLWLPARFAYGERPNRPGVPAGPLTYDVEPLQVVRAPAEPVVPADVKNVPSGAKRLKSGIAYRILRPGSGSAHPSARDIVVLHYSGWTPQGELFDSTLPTGTPERICVQALNKGPAEAVQNTVTSGSLHAARH